MDGGPPFLPVPNCINDHVVVHDAAALAWNRRAICGPGYYDVA